MTKIANCCQNRIFVTLSIRVPHQIIGNFNQMRKQLGIFLALGAAIWLPTKAQQAIAGLSMGGFHSLHISRYYPNTFDYVGLFSPAILPNGNVSSKVYQEVDETLKIQMENGYKLYWIGIGKTDFLYRNVLVYKEKLESMGMPVSYTESEGGHIWKNWRTYLSDFVPQLFQ